MNGYLLDEQVESALGLAAERLQRLPFSCMVGGSCGLLLQGVQLAAKPRDIDLYVDLSHVEDVHQLLKQYAVDDPQYSETAMYTSRLSHYELNGMTIELVGGFCVKSGESIYNVNIDDGLDAYGKDYFVAEQTIKVMPLAHEFVFNILRNRPDRFTPIAQVINASPAGHQDALRWIIEHHHFDKQHIAVMKKLLNAVYKTEGVMGAQNTLFT